MGGGPACSPKILENPTEIGILSTQTESGSQDMYWVGLTGSPVSASTGTPQAPVFSNTIFSNTVSCGENHISTPARQTALLLLLRTTFLGEHPYGELRAIVAVSGWSRV